MGYLPEICEKDRTISPTMYPLYTGYPVANDVSDVDIHEGSQSASIVSGTSEPVTREWSYGQDEIQ